ncbi:hypothetical protein F6X37_34995 [Paraburkholderia sp. 31.1]|nr:hypothetical protein [Paraburkholderia sp. 31.1]
MPCQATIFRRYPPLGDGLDDGLKWHSQTDRQATALRAGDKPVFDGKVTGLDASGYTQFPA